MREHTPQRLARLLALITYLDDNPGVPVDSIAQHFGTSSQQVLDDVTTLWVSGTPGYYHGDLIDFEADEFDRGIVTLTDSRSMSTPLRLGPTEAVSMVVALRSLAAILGHTPVLDATLAKLSRAAGDAAQQADAVQIEPHPARYRQELDAAINSDRQVRIRYVSAADEVTDRAIDPLTLLSDGSHWYVYAWCHRAAAERQFRLDRILDLAILDRARAAHADLRGPAAPPDHIMARAQDTVELQLRPSARWVAEQLPHAGVSDHDDGSFTLTLPVLNEPWLHRLCLELGPAVLAIDPPTTAAEIAAAAESALAAYEQWQPEPGTDEAPSDVPDRDGGELT